MKRRLLVLTVVAAGELAATALWLVWMDRRISRISDLIEEAYNA